MAKPLEIKRIDLLVHPFYSMGIASNKKDADKLTAVWKKHIDEIAKDPSRMLLIKVMGNMDWLPSRNREKSMDARLQHAKTKELLKYSRLQHAKTKELLKYSRLQHAKTKELLKYAKKKLKKRFGFYEASESRFMFYDHLRTGFKDFRNYVKKKGLAVNPETVKTRGLGEYTTACVAGYLVDLNAQIGLKDAIPYRNPQSDLLPRKSVELAGRYPRPGELKGLLKSKKGRELLRKKMKAYIEVRMERMNTLKIRHSKQKASKVALYKPRPHLMKKKRRT